MLLVQGPTLATQSVNLKTLPEIDPSAGTAGQRGFVPGNEMSDWLQAEADVQAGIRGTHCIH